MKNDESKKNYTAKLHFLAFLKRRISRPVKYSYHGIKSCFKYEEAFRIEVYIGVLLLALAPFLADTWIELTILISSVLVVLIVELINSAIENTVDRISLDNHHLSARSKDQGSAAVLLSIILLALIWISIILC
jgi:diacylglycerol kinase (ATP)|tara:strand:- start:383 stop:781 length:399 start_codon:yes stop_codon:yes gene_type:complete